MSANSESSGAWISRPLVVMRVNVALLPQTESRGKKRGEPGCRAITRRATLPPLPFKVVEGVRSERARPLRQPAQGQHLPGSAFAGCFPPEIRVLLPRARHCNPHATRGTAELGWTKAGLCARCGVFCGNITAHVFGSSATC